MEEKPHRDRQNNYSKNCIVCDTVFIGRKNRDYCSPVCKSERANTLAREFKEMTKQDDQARKSNLKILMDLVGTEVDLVISVAKNALDKMGFNSDYRCPAITFKTYRGVWFQIGPYAFQLQKDQKTVKLIKHQ